MTIAIILSLNKITLNFIEIEMFILFKKNFIKISEALSSMTN